MKGEALMMGPEGRIAKVEELKAKWKATAASRAPHQEYDLARLEAEMGQFAPTGTGMREFIPQHVETNPRDVELRQTLFAAGEVATPLWRLIETEKMPAFTAVSLLRDARVGGRKSVDAKRLDQIIAEYLSWPLTELPNGKRIHRRPTFAPRADTTVKANSTRVAAPADTDNFWGALRKSLSAFVEERLQGLDVAQVQRMRGEMEAELDVLLTAWQSKLNRARAKARGHVEVMSRAAVLRACNRLGVDTPTVGRPVNLAHARSMKMKLAREYHPDTGGSEDTRELYNEVIEAFDVLLQYNDTLQGDST